MRMNPNKYLKYEPSVTLINKYNDHTTAMKTLAETIITDR